MPSQELLAAGKKQGQPHKFYVSAAIGRSQYSSQSKHNNSGREFLCLSTGTSTRIWRVLQWDCLGLRALSHTWGCDMTELMVVTKDGNVLH